MGNLCKLSQLKIGESAIIDKINVCGSMRRRLQDLGVITGTQVKCVLINPKGSISAYKIRGAVIAFRNKDSDLIDVKPAFGDFAYERC